jgi:predicted PurR-regulated permease PerM
MLKHAEDLYSKTTFLIIFTLVIIVSFKIASSFLIAILMGGVIAHALKPIQQSPWLLKINTTHTSYIIVIGLIVVVVLPLALFVISLIQQAIQLEKYLVFHDTLTFDSLLETINKWPLLKRLIRDPIQFQNLIKHFATESGDRIRIIAMSLAQEIPSLFIQTLITIISCFVFLSEGDKFSLWLSDKIPLKKEIKISLLKSFNQSSTNAVWASLAASGAQAIMVFFSFLVFDIPAAFLAAGATFVFNFIPILGAMPAWILGSLYLYFQNSFLQLGIFIIVALISSVIESVVRVLVLKGHHGLPTLVGLVAVFGGIQFFGFFGVLIGPIIVALLISMCEVWPQVLKNRDEI